MRVVIRSSTYWWLMIYTYLWCSQANFLILLVLPVVNWKSIAPIYCAPDYYLRVLKSIAFPLSELDLHFSAYYDFLSQAPFELCFLDSPV